MIDLKRGKIIPLEAANLCRCFDFWDFEFNMEKRERIESDMNSGRRSMFVFAHEERYVGGVSLSALDENTCCISYLAVEEGCKNKGIGTALIKYVCDYAKNLNFKKVWLEVDYANIRAKELYQRLGFSDDEGNPQSRIRMTKYLA